MGASLDVTVIYPCVPDCPYLSSLCAAVADNCLEYSRTDLLASLRQRRPHRPCRYHYSADISCVRLDEYSILFFIFRTDLRQNGSSIVHSLLSCAASPEFDALISDRYLFSHLVRLSATGKDGRKLRRRLMSGELAWTPSPDAHILLADGCEIGTLIKR